MCVAIVGACWLPADGAATHVMIYDICLAVQVTGETVWQRPAQLVGVSLGITTPAHGGAPPPPSHAPTAAAEHHPAAAAGGAPSPSAPSAAQRAEWADLEREWVPQTNAADGRTYYFNARLNETAWEKPVYDPSILQRQQERLAAHRHDLESKAAAADEAFSVDSEIEVRSPS